MPPNSVPSPVEGKGSRKATGKVKKMLKLGQSRCDRLIDNLGKM